MLRNSVLFASVGLLGVALGSGCSGSTTSDGAQPVPADQFVERVVSAVCDNVGPCCQSAGFPYDPAACKALGNSDLSANYALGNPNVDYDAVAAGKCVAAISDLVRSCGAVDLDGLEQCDLVLVGKLPAGAACQKSVECAAPAGGNAYCDQGACVTEPRGTAGDARTMTCTEHGTSSGCTGGTSSGSGTAACYTNDGLYCNGTCKPLPAIGEPCSYEGCVAGAYCDGSVCVATPKVGEPCGGGYQCPESSYCDANGTCQAAKANGAACGEATECASSRCKSGICVVDQIASASLCSGQSSGP